MSTHSIGRTLTAVAVSIALAACTKKEAAKAPIETAPVERRTIVVDAQATGAVEPINVIEVKSKASGMITRMPVETGTQVQAGDLLVQIDTRDVKNQYDQALSDLRTAEAQLEVAQSQKKRSDELYKARIITAQEYETSQLGLTQAQGQIVRARTSLDLAKQRLEDATVVAPVAGTIIDKPVALGQVIASATGSVSGGTTLLKMADLSRVRLRALVNETDIGSVRAGQSARVIVDAYPDRPFQGTVEKIEPQAVVQQSVTMFPVIVTLDNTEGYLKPGMNGEVSLLIDRRENVLAVSNDAVKTLREAQTAALLVGLKPESVQVAVRTQQAAMGNGNGRGNGAAGPGTPAGDTPATRSVPANGARGNRGGQGAQGAQGGSGEQRVVQSGDVTGADSTRGNAARRGGGNGATGGAPGMGQRGGRRGGDSTGARRGQGMGGTRMAGRNGGAGGAGRMNGMANAQGMSADATAVRRTRMALVFVQNDNGVFDPRVVKLGASNYDYSEVISGLKEGEKVALLAVASLQQKRDQQNDRFRNQQGGPVPGMQRQGGAGGPPGAGGGAAGGGGGGGGGRPPGGR